MKAAKIKSATTRCGICSKRCRITAERELLITACRVRRVGRGVDMTDQAYVGLPALAVAMTVRQCLSTPAMFPSIFGTEAAL
jgi:hypothetical protein